MWVCGGLGGKGVGVYIGLVGCLGRESRVRVKGGAWVFQVWKGVGV